MRCLIPVRTCAKGPRRHRLRCANGARYRWFYDERHARIKEERSAVGSADRITWMLHPDQANGLPFEQDIRGSTLAAD